MEWLNLLTGKVVGLDTAPLIYFIEQNPKYITTVREFFKRYQSHIIIYLKKSDRFCVINKLRTIECLNMPVLIYP
jgi:hypothetical protein